MKKSIGILFVAINLFASGCGGGKHASNSLPTDASADNEDPSQTVNGEISGKIYYSEHGWCYELDLPTGVRRQVYFYDLGTWPLPSPDGKEFAGGANTTINGNYYLNEDIIFFNLDGQAAGRRMINGDVRDVVKISPDGRYIAFNWVNDPEDGLVVLERNGTWERNFVRANGRGFDWTSSGGLVFARGNEIYKVEDIATSEPEKMDNGSTGTEIANVLLVAVFRFDASVDTMAHS